MAEYLCNSKECEGRLFESHSNTARCIHCGSSDIQRTDRAWLAPAMIFAVLILAIGAFLSSEVVLGEAERESLRQFQLSGCKDTKACNFVPLALINDAGSCTYDGELRDCNGLCKEDEDGDGVCDSQEVTGCIDEAACNFDEKATEEGACEYPEPGFTCAGNCLSDRDGDGICDANEVSGCTDPQACNFNADATDPDGSCWYREVGKRCEDGAQSVRDGVTGDENSDADNRSDVEPEPAPPLEDLFEGDNPFMVVENMPAFGPCTLLSGDERHECTQVWIVNYVSENTNYPPSAKDEGIQGTVFVYFVVGRNGNVGDVKVLREVDPRLDSEAIRVVRSLPQFEPGQQRGKAVSVQYTIPVKFIIT